MRKVGLGCALNMALTPKPYFAKVFGLQVAGAAKHLQ